MPLIPPQETERCDTCDHLLIYHSSLDGPRGPFECRMERCDCVWRDDKETPVYSDLEKAKRISRSIQDLKLLQKTIKDVFAHRLLDGGPRAALDHPMYLQAESQITKLEEEMTYLI